MRSGGVLVMLHKQHAGMTGQHLPGKRSRDGFGLCPDKREQHHRQRYCFPELPPRSHETVYCRGRPARQSVICVTRRSLDDRAATR